MAKYDFEAAVTIFFSHLNAAETTLKHNTGIYYHCLSLYGKLVFAVIDQLIDLPINGAVLFL